MKSQKGYTLIELLFVVAFFAVIGLVGGVIYAAIHFIAKVW